MTFWDKITGNDMTKEFKNFESRVKKLPDDYQKSWEEINDNLLIYGNFSGRNLMPILNAALDILEETAANGQNIKDVLGNDIQSFCSDIAGVYDSKSFNDKWRKQLNDKIARKLGK